MVRKQQKQATQPHTRSSPLSKPFRQRTQPPSASSIPPVRPARKISWSATHAFCIPIQAFRRGVLRSAARALTAFLDQRVLEMHSWPLHDATVEDMADGDSYW